jgi:hypothetical protein
MMTGQCGFKVWTGETSAQVAAVFRTWGERSEENQEEP